MILRLCCVLSVCLAVGSLKARKGSDDIQIYVDSHGWHTGIILPVKSIPPDLKWSIAEDFRQYPFIEIGWGHKAFYMARRFDVGIALTGLFGVSPSVMHVCGVPGPPESYFVESRVYPLSATTAEFRRLCTSILASTKLDSSGRAIALGPGLYGDSRFYEANGKYYLPKTCNYWTSARLRDAGYDVTPFFAMSAGGVCRQVRRIERDQKTASAPPPGRAAATR